MQVSPFTMDVIHLIFTCCGAEVMGDWTEMLNDYYDYIKVADAVSLIIYAEHLTSSFFKNKNVYVLSSLLFVFVGFHILLQILP